MALLCSRIALPAISLFFNLFMIWLICPIQGDRVTRIAENERATAASPKPPPLPAVNVTADGLANAKQWCDYLRHTKEPKVLLYNRLSKCGSTTMKLLFDTLSIDREQFIHWDAPSEYWTDLDEEHDLRQKFIDTINMKMKEEKGKSILVDGHWFHTNFVETDFGGKSIGHIQLLRECKARRHSKFLYGLFDSSAAYHAKEKGENAYNKFKNEYLSSNMDIDDCIRDYKCLQGSKKFNKNDTEVIFLCGSKCKTQWHGDMNAGAHTNFLDPETFTVIGALDYMPHYMEMLECAFPTMLKGIYDVYMKENVHGMEGSHSTTYTPAMEKILNEACNPNWNGYVHLFEEIKENFITRYNYMVANRANCCRVPKVKRQELRH